MRLTRAAASVPSHRGGYHPPAPKSVWRHPPRTLRRGRCPRRPAAPRPSVGAGPRPARGPAPFVGAAFGRPGVWGPRPHGSYRGRSPLYINWVAGGFRKLADGFRKKLCFSAPSTKCLPKQGRNALGRKGLREWGRPGEAKCLPKVYQGNFCRSNERLFCCFERFPQPFPACHRCCTLLSYFKVLPEPAKEGHKPPKHGLLSRAKMVWMRLCGQAAGTGGR